MPGHPWPHLMKLMQWSNCLLQSCQTTWKQSKHELKTFWKHWQCVISENFELARACLTTPSKNQMIKKKSFLDCLTKWKKPIPNNLTLSWVLLMDLLEILIRVKAVFKFHYQVVSNIIAKAEASKHCFPRQCLSNLLAKVIRQFSVLASANTMAVSGSYLGNVLHKSQVKRLGN